MPGVVDPRVSLRRESSPLGPHYYTRCGRFWIHQEFYPPHRWFVNERDGDSWDDAFPADGFRTLRQARAYAASMMVR